MSRKKYPHIFSEGKIGNITIPNRMVMAPMGVGIQNAAAEIEDRMVEFYGERAQGGMGLILVEDCYVSSKEEDPYPLFFSAPRIDSQAKVSAFQAVANRIKMYGCVPGLQLGAGEGRNARQVLPGRMPKTSCRMPTVYSKDIICEEMTKEEISDLVSRFARAARLALMAGFEVVEVHAHSGYLLEQYLSEAINKRTDEYGGSYENRFRICKEIREAIRDAVGDKLGVSIRLSTDHRVPDGITTEEGLEYAKLAEEAGYDAVHVDAGSAKALDWTVPSPYIGKTPLRQYAKLVKERVNIPVITVGSYLMPDEAEEALAAGDADFVALGRPILADPDWVNKALRGQEDLIRGCIQCNERCSEWAFTSKRPTCSVNPMCGFEGTLHITPAQMPRNITIVGGGPAGMVAGLVASRRGHKVTLLEKKNELGGWMNLICKEKGKLGIKNYRKYIINQVEMSNIDVRLGCEATVENVKATNPDAVIAATGSYLFVPDFLGATGDNVVTIEQLYDRKLNGDEKIVVLGGGVNGSEVAMYLAQDGHKVTVVEMTSDFSVNLGIMNRFSIVSELNKNKNITLCPNTKSKCIDGNVLVCENAEGEEIRLPFDLLVSAIGMGSNDELAKKLDEEFNEVYIIGDAEQHLKIGDAVHRGFFTAMKL